MAYEMKGETRDRLKKDADADRKRQQAQASVPQKVGAGNNNPIQKLARLNNRMVDRANENYAQTDQPYTGARGDLQNGAASGALSFVKRGANQLTSAPAFKRDLSRNDGLAAQKQNQPPSTTRKTGVFDYDPNEVSSAAKGAGIRQYSPNKLAGADRNNLGLQRRATNAAQTSINSYNAAHDAGPQTRGYVFGKHIDQIKNGLTWELDDGRDITITDLHEYLKHEDRPTNKGGGSLSVVFDKRFTDEAIEARRAHQERVDAFIEKRDKGIRDRNREIEREQAFSDARSRWYDRYSRNYIRSTQGSKEGTAIGGKLSDPSVVRTSRFTERPLTDAERAAGYAAEMEALHRRFGAVDSASVAAEAGTEQQRIAQSAQTQRQQMEQDNQKHTLRPGERLLDANSNVIGQGADKPVKDAGIPPDVMNLFKTESGQFDEAGNQIPTFDKDGMTAFNLLRSDLGLKDEWSTRRLGAMWYEADSSGVDLNDFLAVMKDPKTNWQGFYEKYGYVPKMR